MSSTTPIQQNKDKERRPEWLLLLLLALLSFLCIFCSTSLALVWWPSQVETTLLSDRQADYTNASSDVQFAVLDPSLGEQAAIDSQYLQITPTYHDGEPSIIIADLPGTPTPTLNSNSIPLPSFETDTPPTSTSNAPDPTATANRLTASPPPNTGTPGTTGTPFSTGTSNATGTPEPTETPSTLTPVATATAAPSITPLPSQTSTPRPLPTHTPRSLPTDTPPPLGADTPIPATNTPPSSDDDPSVPATNTPIPPTNTSIPTNTPTTTPTPAPTNTPTVTNTPTPIIQISGRVFEDTNYSGGDGTAFGAGDVLLANVQVELYDGGGLIDTVTTDLLGAYTFTNAPGIGTYTVRVVSATLGDTDTPPAAGFNGGFFSATAEQTYEHDGLAGNGGTAALGGNSPTTSDLSTGAGAGVGDTNVSVTVSGLDLTGVDFGFTYNLVTNLQNSNQGSFRQTISNANAIVGTDTIIFNITGAAPYTIQPTSDLPTVTDRAIIDGTSQPGYAGTPLIQLDGINISTSSIAGLHITAGNSTVRGLAITRFSDSGIVLSNGDNNVIQSNYIGTNTTGTVSLGNTIGISITQSSSNLIGGGLIGSGNLISGNASYGIQINNTATENTVRGNLIGTDITGTTALGNNDSGIRVLGNNNTIGGTTTNRRNIISGNNNHGIFIAGNGSGNMIQGNYIGTDITGTSPLGNTKPGIRVSGNNNTIGGTSANQRNIISGNGDEGVLIRSSNGNVVQGNYIGTDVTGTSAIPNNNPGIRVLGNNNTIGGTAANVKNIISGNRDEGIIISNSNGNVIRGNYIGTDVTGTMPLSNSLGILIDNSTNTLIGGTTPNAGNIIAYNSDVGIDIIGTITSTGNAVISNTIYANAGLGIDLNNDDVTTANDPGDVDSGPNDLLNFPIIYNATLITSTVVITGEARPNSTVEFFIADPDPSGHGEGRIWLGSGSVTSGTPGAIDPTAWEFSFVLPVGALLPGNEVTATATDAADNTSEFAQNVVVN